MKTTDIIKDRAKHLTQEYPTMVEQGSPMPEMIAYHNRITVIQILKNEVEILEYDKKNEFSEKYNSVQEDITYGYNQALQSTIDRHKATIKELNK